MGSVFKIQKFCTADGDGIRTTVFLKGCPLRCLWCHNPEGLSARPSLLFYAERCVGCGRCLDGCPARRVEDGKLVLDRERCIACGKCVDVCPKSVNSLFGREMTAEEVMQTVMQDAIFYETSGGGMTVSGGEPSLQSDFTLSLLRLAKENGIGRAVETCGYGDRSFYENAASYGTTFLYDLKCMNAEKHQTLTGVSNEKILSNLRFLFEIGADVVLRLPMIPGVNDSDDDLSRLRSFLLGYSGKYRYAEIMPYHDLGVGKARALGIVQNDYKPEDPDAAAARWKESLSPIDVRVSGT